VGYDDTSRSCRFVVARRLIGCFFSFLFLFFTQKKKKKINPKGPGADADSIAKKLLAVACKSTDNATVIILKLE
jgi:hypothetical protein